MDFINSFLNAHPKIIGIIPRRNAGPGIYLSFLLPFALLIGCCDKNNHESNCIFVAYAFHSLLNSCLLIIRGRKNQPFDLKKDFYVASVVPAMVMILIYVTLLNIGSARSLCNIVANNLIYVEGIQLLFKAFPKTFTFGEANITIQGISLFLLGLALKLDLVTSIGPPNNEYDTATCIIQFAVFCLTLYCLVPYVAPNLRNTMSMYMCTLALVICIYVLIFNLLKIDLVLWIWEFLNRPQRVNLVFFWSLCCVVGVLAVCLQINSRKKSNTIIRKVFHALLSIVFFSGIIYDVNLIYFSSGCVFCLFILLEVFRIAKVAPFSEFLQQGFNVFSDEKDSGGFALTPISLLIGTCLPLWLFPLKAVTRKDHVVLLSGVFSVGIGDTFASIGGKLFGKHRWPGSKKTMEGTVCCIVSQLLFSVALSHFDLLSTNPYFCFPVIITSLVEAMTDQIDNIVLPLVMYIFVYLTYLF